jgi:non-ribosomal peptide synthetase component F
MQLKMKPDRPTASSFTLGTVLRAAWAVTAATYTSSDVVIIGSTLSGRNAPFPGINRVNGPTFTTVPVRLQPWRDKSVYAFLSEVQRKSAEMIPFEHTGLSKISKLGLCAKLACNFRTLMYTQISHHAVQAPFDDAACAWDGNMSYSELDLLSTLFADHLVRLGVCSEQMVPVCMDKSKWAVVSVLATFKAGGVYVPLDPRSAETRLRAISRQTGATICLASPAQQDLCRKLCRDCILVEDYLPRANNPSDN